MKKREITPLRWTGKTLRLLDQLALPARERWFTCTTADQVGQAIQAMRIRGAPAIGVAAAYGMALAGQASQGRTGQALLADLKRAAGKLVRTRPTAVNLAWAVKRILNAACGILTAPPSRIRDRVEQEARAIEAEDLAANRAMGQLGARLLKPQANVLTHCNTGGLATAGYGTALGVIRAAHAQGKIKLVFVDETRPYLQGARLTAWELKQERIPFVLIADNMAGHFMQRGQVSEVVVGADRITARGDTANKIGTYPLAELARIHRIPFYVAAPISTIDLATKRGEDIPIEERSTQEMVQVGTTRIAPNGIKAAHPAFDVTPGSLITAIITDRGVARPPYATSLPKLVNRRGTPTHVAKFKDGVSSTRRKAVRGLTIRSR